MENDAGGNVIHDLIPLAYIKQKPAADFLGVDPRTLQRLAHLGKIRTLNNLEEMRGRVYCVQDIENVKKYGVELGGITLRLEDGMPTLERKMKPLPEQTLVERLDYAWAILARHGLLKNIDAEKVRCNVSYAVIKSEVPRTGQFACLKPDGGE